MWQCWTSRIGTYEMLVEAMKADSLLIIQKFIDIKQTFIFLVLRILRRRCYNDV